MSGSPVGRSTNTETKQAHLAYFLGYHIPVVQHIIRHGYSARRYVYIDLNAGDGGTDELRGSPVIAAEMLAAAQLPAEVWCCERNPESMAQLEVTMAARRRGRFWPEVRFLLGDHCETIATVLAYYRAQAWRGPFMGLTYFDPNGDPLDVSLLNRIVEPQYFGKLDILAHITANGAYKRTRHLHSERFLSRDLDAIDKSKQFIRRPRDAWQWTFVHLTNWAKAPPLNRIDFVALESPEGRAVLDLLDFSRSERQPTLPLVGSMAGRDS